MQNSTVMVHKKVVVVGDGACGKTCLSVAFSKNEFPEEHVPTIFDTYIKTVTIEDQTVQLAIWDTAGEEDYDRLRPLSYANASVIIVCFAIDNPISFHHVTAKWAPEMRHYCRNVPIILVGNKLDLRNNSETIRELAKCEFEPVSYDMGLKISKKIKARCYFECSAKHMMGVHNVFRKAAEIIVKEEKKKHYFTCMPS